MKAAPTTALTIAVKVNELSDDDDLNIEIVEEPQDKTLSHYTLLDLVLHHHKDILYIKSSNESFDLITLLGNEKSLNLFEQIIQKKSKAIYDAITLPSLWQTHWFLINMLLLLSLFRYDIDI